MTEEGKKISFGFSKLPKKVNILSSAKPVKTESVQFIDCLEDKSIRVKNEEPKKDSFLVIPLPKKDGTSVVDKIKIEPSDNLHKTTEVLESSVVVNIEKDNPPETLDDLAAREILEDLKKEKVKDGNTDVFSVPLTTDAPKGEKESTLEDYDNIPIDQFGLAMLRGMGWAPGKGIGKNEQTVAVVKQPPLRPKGLGLGADKVIKEEAKSKVSVEPIKLVKGSFVRIIAGAYKDCFGEILGFDEESGRLIVKMALGGSVVTFNEFMVQGVLKEDYIKNSKVINVSKYEEYKKKEEETKSGRNVQESSTDNYRRTVKKSRRSSTEEISDDSSNRKEMKKEKSRRRSISKEKYKRRDCSSDEDRKSRTKRYDSHRRTDERSRKPRKYSSDSSPERHRSSKDPKKKQRGSSCSSVESRHSSPDVRNKSKKSKQKSRRRSRSSSPELKRSYSSKSHKKHKKHKSRYD